MANNKQRYINTRFWNDNYISDLDPTEKLLFIYFLTNEHTNISGIYELPLKIIGIETGIDVSMLKKIFPRLKNKIGYIDGIVVVKNFIKHQETGSPLVKKGILNCLKDFDIEFLKNIVKQGYYTLPKEYCDTLCIPYAKGLNYSNSNLDSKLEDFKNPHLPAKKKDMKKYNENKHSDFGGDVVDYDTGKITTEENIDEGIEERKNLVKYFNKKCKDILDVEPVKNVKITHTVARRALTVLNKKQIKDLLEDWFATGKPPEDLIQITQAFSSNNINRYKANHYV